MIFFFAKLWFCNYTYPDWSVAVYFVRGNTLVAIEPDYMRQAGLVT